MMRAAGHPDRAQILDALRSAAVSSGSLSITEVAASCDLDRFSASRHLTMLRSVGLVVEVRSGYRREHTLRAEAFEAIEDWAIQFTCCFAAPGLDPIDGHSGARKIASPPP